jgi:hypothetical protein
MLWANELLEGQCETQADMAESAQLFAYEPSGRSSSDVAISADLEWRLAVTASHQEFSRRRST